MLTELAAYKREFIEFLLQNKALKFEGAMNMYKIAARAGVNNFVVPGNKPDVIEQIKAIIEEEGITPTFYAPGFVAQGGKISDATKVAGNSWSAIVGRGIYGVKDRRAAALEHVSQL